MKIGKIITIILAVLICGIMVFMLSQTPPKKEKAEASVQPKVEQNFTKQQSKSSEEFASEDELKKVKELSLSVAKTQNEGVSKQYLTSCAPCHGANGKGVVAPDITHLSKEDLLKKTS
ncbi:c-type cytochrome [Campylobacter concisus]|uniref:c-type cytochrome n=1 Tax=Campylobacter concisus TaxID=199 RepID=UPI0021561879|nr:c-type cytochrome [Campylobacter concisus]